MSDQASLISGTCAGGFEAVRAAFENNFTQHSEVGAAVAVWVDGDLVVNLWGGHADARRRRRWRENTLASVFSATKGLTSTCMHLLAPSVSLKCSKRRAIFPLEETHLYLAKTRNLY